MFSGIITHLSYIGIIMFVLLKAIEKGWLFNEDIANFTLGCFISGVLLWLHDKFTVWRKEKKELKCKNTLQNNIIVTEQEN